MLCEWFGTGKDSAVEEEKRRRNSALHTRSRIRFGPYELDLRTAELRKNTLRIRLQEQPFLILVALLERPGEVVLREEIRKRLWPDDTVVEFDHGINAAVKRLRDALCESVERPRYIETLARKGYRFIGKIEADLTEPAELSVSQHESVGPANALGDPKYLAQVQPLKEDNSVGIELRQTAQPFVHAKHKNRWIVASGLAI